MSRELPSCEDAKVTVVLMWLFLMTSETEAKDHTTIHRRQGHTTIPLFSGVVITFCTIPFTGDGDYECLLPARVLSFKSVPPFLYICFSLTQGKCAELGRQLISDSSPHPNPNQPLFFK